MITIDSKIEIYLYAGSTDMRKGIHGLAMMNEVTPMSQTKNDSKRETFFANY